MLFEEEEREADELLFERLQGQARIPGGAARRRRGAVSSSFPSFGGRLATELPSPVGDLEERLRPLRKGYGSVGLFFLS